jgi:hypothetical protein
MKMILYRPVGFNELKLIAETNYTAFPPRLPDQPIFYPVLNFEYAEQIAKGWNTRYNNPPCGFITRFEVKEEYVKKFEVQIAGARIHQELWVPAEALEEFNQNIIGKISVQAAYYGEGFDKEIEKETNLPREILQINKGETI